MGISQSEGTEAINKESSCSGTDQLNISSAFKLVLWCSGRHAKGDCDLLHFPPVLTYMQRATY